jgi:methyl-accepting chemotaxis protein
MRLNLTGKMIASFLIIVLICAGGFGFIYFNLQTLSTSVHNVDEEELPRLAKANEIAFNSMGQAASIRGFLLTGNETYVKDYKQLAETNAKIEQLLIETARDERLKKRLQEIKEVDDRYSFELDQKVIPLKQAGKHDEAVLANSEFALPLSKDLLNKVNEYKKERSELANQGLMKAVENSDQAKKTVLFTALLSLVIGVGIGILTARSIAKPVQSLVEVARGIADGDLTQKIKIKRHDEIGQLEQAFMDMIHDLKTIVQNIQENAQQVAASSEELTASAEQSSLATNQIATSVSDVALATEHQVSAVIEASTAIEQLSVGIGQVAANANSVADVSGKAASAALDGEKSVTIAIKQMLNIEKTVNHSAQVVMKLGDRSKEIGQIVNTISDIAAQTNLLALNAAIEAARAGEQGRGFAVVAEEVRKLAEQSQEASKQIASLIAEIQGDTAKAVTSMNEGTREVKVGTDVVNTAGEAFNQIVTLINQVSSQVQEATAALEQMASGSHQVVDSIRAIDRISKENAGKTQTVSAATEEQSASFEEMAASSQSLAQMSQDLENIINKFKM